MNLQSFEFDKASRCLMFTGKVSSRAGACSPRILVLLGFLLHRQRRRSVFFFISSGHGYPSPCYLTNEVALGMVRALQCSHGQELRRTAGERRYGSGLDAQAGGKAKYRITERGSKIAQIGRCHAEIKTRMIGGLSAEVAQPCGGMMAMIA